MNGRVLLPVVATLALSSLALACSEGTDGQDAPPSSAGSSGGPSAPSGGAGGADEGSATSLDPQVPPSSAEEVAGWLEAFESNGWEEDWVCEAEYTEKSGGAAAIHAHGANRVCNNQALAAATLEGDAELPVGAAALKFVERGTYVEVKTEPRSDGGQGWFWYAPNGEVAGTGVAGCTGCHSAAGADDDHPGLGDYVYFQVK